MQLLREKFSVPDDDDADGELNSPDDSLTAPGMSADDDCQGRRQPFHRQWLTFAVACWPVEKTPGRFPDWRTDEAWEECGTGDPRARCEGSG